MIAIRARLSGTLFLDAPLRCSLRSGAALLRALECAPFGRSQEQRSEDPKKVFPKAGRYLSGFAGVFFVSICGGAL